MPTYLGPLHEMASTTPTDFWNDSCSITELSDAIQRGAVGATTNPSIVLEVLKKEMHLWRDRIPALAEENPTWSEVDVAWKLTQEMAQRGAELLRPVFERERGRKGRLSIQTSPLLYRDAEALVEQAMGFAALAPNMQVKIPATRAGIAALEEATYRGVNVNATVSFTVPQALAVGEAVERGLRRREREGLATAGMSPVCTIMVGRLDDWLKVVMEKDGVVTDPGYANWAGIACLKRAYRIYGERGYRTRLLAAAYRHHLHWTEFVGGDVILTMPWVWQKRFDASGLPVRNRFDHPVDPAVIAELSARFPDFRRAYEPSGLTVDEFDLFPPTRRTLRAFTQSYQDLLASMREVLMPNPDR